MARRESTGLSSAALGTLAALVLLITTVSAQSSYTNNNNNLDGPSLVAIPGSFRYNWPTDDTRADGKAPVATAIAAAIESLCSSVLNPNLPPYCWEWMSDLCGELQQKNQDGEIQTADLPASDEVGQHAWAATLPDATRSGANSSAVFNGTDDGNWVLLNDADFDENGQYEPTPLNEPISTNVASLILASTLAHEYLHCVQWFHPDDPDATCTLITTHLEIYKLQLWILDCQKIGAGYLSSWEIRQLEEFEDNLQIYIDALNDRKAKNGC